MAFSDKCKQIMFAAALVLASSQMAPAQSDDWNKVVAAARQEGQVIVWAQAGEQSRKFWKDAFEKDNPGIKVELFQASNSSERDTRVLRERDAGVFKADVLVAGSGGMIGRLKPAKAIQPLLPFMRPDILDSKNWLNSAPVWVDNEKQYVLIADLPAGTPAITNPAIPEGEIRDWDDLLSPQYDGKIISLDPRQSGLAFAYSLFMYTNPDLGPGYVEKFYKGGRVVFTPDQRQIAEWVDSGRMQVGFALRESEIAPILQIGSKIRVLPRSSRVACRKISSSAAILPRRFRTLIPCRIRTQPAFMSIGCSRGKGSRQWSISKACSASVRMSMKAVCRRA